MMGNLLTAGLYCLLAIWAALSVETLYLFSSAGIFRENRLWKLKAS